MLLYLYSKLFHEYDLDLFVHDNNSINVLDIDIKFYVIELILLINYCSNIRIYLTRFLLEIYHKCVTLKVLATVLKTDEFCAHSNTVQRL